MRVKIGNKWFSVETDQPIMIELTAKDKQNIQNMAENATQYACFPEDNASAESRSAWMTEPAEDVPPDQDIYWFGEPCETYAYGDKPILTFPIYDTSDTGKFVGVSLLDMPTSLVDYTETIIPMSLFMDAKITHSRIAYGNETSEEILEHAIDEIREIREDPSNAEEWIDLAFLALDGAWRSARWSILPRDGLTGVEVVQVMWTKFQELLERFDVKNTVVPFDIHGSIAEPDDILRTIDSRTETLEHRQHVQEGIELFVRDLVYRGRIHDESKLHEPEKSGLDRLAYENFKVGPVAYGTPEYKDRISLFDYKHHQSSNRHHPEYFRHGINDMNLSDIVEMLCDWRAASMRDGVQNPIIQLSSVCERFGIVDQLRYILINTLRTMNWDFK